VICCTVLEPPLGCLLSKDMVLLFFVSGSKIISALVMRQLVSDNNKGPGGLQTLFNPCNGFFHRSVVHFQPPNLGR
jgi:hypothetical protein